MSILLSTSVRSWHEWTLSFSLAVLLASAIPCKKADAALTGYLEQVAPSPQVYLEDVDFRTFGPDASAAIGDVTGFLQLVPNSGSPADFAGFAPGNIALIERGAIPFSEKVINAADAGAIGALVYNNVAGEPVQGGFSAVLTTIPALSITQSLGHEFASQLVNSAVEVRLSVQPIPEPSGVLLLTVGLLVLAGAVRRKLRRY